jgi:hypothetical protein
MSPQGKSSTSGRTPRPSAPRAIWGSPRRQSLSQGRSPVPWEEKRSPYKLQAVVFGGTIPPRKQGWFNNDIREPNLHLTYKHLTMAELPRSGVFCLTESKKSYPPIAFKSFSGVVMGAMLHFSSSMAIILRIIVVPPFLVFYCNDAGRSVKTMLQKSYNSRKICIKRIRNLDTEG